MIYRQGPDNDIYVDAVDRYYGRLVTVSPRITGGWRVERRQMPAGGAVTHAGVGQWPVPPGV